MFDVVFLSEDHKDENAAARAHNFEESEPMTSHRLAGRSSNGATTRASMTTTVSLSDRNGTANIGENSAPIIVLQVSFVQVTLHKLF